MAVILSLMEKIRPSSFGIFEKCPIISLSKPAIPVSHSICLLLFCKEFVLKLNIFHLGSYSKVNWIEIHMKEVHYGTTDVFVNGQPSVLMTEIAYGSLENPKLTFTGTVKLRAGINRISLLSFSMGLANVGVHYETYNTGILGPVTLKGLNEGTRDLTNQKWSYKKSNCAQTSKIVVYYIDLGFVMELESHDLEEFKFMIDVNVIGTFHLIKAALPGMKGRKERGPGSIAIISSQAGQIFETAHKPLEELEILFGLKFSSGLEETLRYENHPLDMVASLFSHAVITETYPHSHML
ncbi:hypothetical protein POM88_042629 [Heracleum sosnowskyi]|uniref:Uncharacterized protein n=1 Tax=Heracleum sosnowskyi TaxID=360622 RepID=A0AAD8MCD5_9APIA|nr:hypothetical protein POM88_042629 [Heracleum sosnowskyi]